MAYRFEPLSRRTVMLGVSPVQLVVAGGGLVAAVVAVRTWPGVKGFALAAVALAAAGALCRPVGGRPALHWFALAATYLSARRRAVVHPPAHLAPRQVPRSGEGTATSAPLRTSRSSRQSALEVGPLSPGTWLTEVAADGRHGPMGVLLGARAGTAALVLRARGTAFRLLDKPEQERRLAAWAGALEALAVSRTSIAGIQWCQRGRPAGSGAVAAHLQALGDKASPGFGEHEELLRHAVQREWAHDSFIVLAAHRDVRGRSLSDLECSRLRQEMTSLRTQLRNAGISCDGVLDAPGLARAIGAFMAPELDRHRHCHPWPIAIDEQWAQVRADAYWYRSYWVAEWPRSPVGPDFLSPLLTGRGHRSTSVAMSPVPAQKASREAEASRTAHAADARLRAQGGFLDTARHRRQSEAVEGRETQLADGRSAFRFSGYIAVCGKSLVELEESCSETERVAGAARICLRPLFGQQREALTWALPFGSGF